MSPPSFPPAGGPGSSPEPRDAGGALFQRLVLPVTEGLGLAVSGGGDSMAMLYLLAPLRPRVATVNHNLRPEAALEAQMVAETCAGLGLDHVTLDWHWDGRGNLSDAARRARRDLLAAWNPVVLLAHTQDDVAETFLMRLMRGAGVDGLSAMSPQFPHRGATFLRPLLTTSRAELRAYLTQIGATWAEDPSNQNPRYLRARTRAALRDLPSDAIAASARHLAEARLALDALADTWSPRAFTPDRGTLLWHPALFEAPAETQRRLLTRAILTLAPAPYPPRGEALTRLLISLAKGAPATLAGVRFAKGRAFREARSLPPPVPVPQIWDRWTATAPPGCTLGALGRDLPATWRETGLPRAALAASPAIRRNGALLAAPFAGVNHSETMIRPCLPELMTVTAALSH